MTLAVSFEISPLEVGLSPTVVVAEFPRVGLQGPPGPPGAGIAWSEVAVSSVALAAGGGYVMNNASRVVGTLPATAPQFGVIRVCGKGAGGWRISQNAGQTIHFDGNSTTTGTAGYLASQGPFDCIDLLVITANTDFLVTSSIGNISGV